MVFSDPDSDRFALFIANSRTSSYIRLIFRVSRCIAGVQLSSPFVAARDASAPKTCNQFYDGMSSGGFGRSDAPQFAIS
jgi:hypothetical protein